MSGYQHRAFVRRTARIQKAHRKRDRQGAGLPLIGRLPFFSLVVALALGLAMKALIFANVSGGSYNQVVLDLSQGNVFEQALAWALKPDPITVELSRFVKPPS